MDDSPAGSILLFVIFILGSGYFSATEISLASVNRIHMMSSAAKGKRNAKRVLYILDRFEEALSVILIGNNIMNIGCATLSAVIATRIWGTTAVTWSTVITTIVLFLFGEMIPKCFARSCNEKFAEAVSGSLIFLMKLLKPLSVMFTALSAAVAAPFRKNADSDVTMTEDELHDIVDNISEDDGFDEDTGRLVKSALDFSESTAQEIMVPWSEVQTIRTSMKTGQILAAVKESVHSRIPVTDRAGNIKGILQIRKFLKTYVKSNRSVILASVMDYPYYVKPDISIDDLLTAMSNHRRNLAIVKSGDTVLGIVTVEDILEQLVGEIYDEDDIGGDSDE